MIWLSQQGTRSSQPQGFTRLRPEIAALTPGVFLGSQPSNLVGNTRTLLTTPNVAKTNSPLGPVFGGNGTNAIAYTTWRGINANTNPAVTFLVVVRNKGGSQQAFAGFGASTGSAGNTLFRLIQGVDSANTIRVQAQDSNGNTSLNRDFPVFGFANGQFHAIVVTIQYGGPNTGATCYANGRLVGSIPADWTGTPVSTNFNFLNVCGAVRGGAPVGFANVDVALFVPIIGKVMPEAWCLRASTLSGAFAEVFEGPTQIWTPILTAGGNLFLQSLSSSITAAGGISKLTDKKVFAVTPISGSINRFTNKTPLVGQISTSSNLSEGAGISYSTSGSITTTGSIRTAATFVRNYASQIVLTGGLVKSISKLLTGSISLTGSAFKGLYKLITGIISLSGSVSSFKFTPAPGGLINRGMRFMRRFIGRR